MSKALEELARHLQFTHRNYTIRDVEPTQSKGYLRFTKPCPRNDIYCGGRSEHYHTLDISGRPSFVYGKYGRGMYAFWRAVCAELEARHEPSTTPDQALS